MAYNPFWQLLWRRLIDSYGLDAVERHEETIRRAAEKRLSAMYPEAYGATI